MNQPSSEISRTLPLQWQLAPLFLVGFFSTVMFLYFKNYQNIGQWSQTWEFGEIARNLIQGDGFSFFHPQGVLTPSFYMPPAYPFFLAAMFKMFGQTVSCFKIIGVIQISVNIINCYLVIKIARVFFGERTAVAAGWIYACYPPLMYIPIEYHPITFYICVTLTLVYLVVTARVSHMVWYDLWIGFFLGLFVLFRGEGPLTVIPLAIGVWCVQHNMQFVLRHLCIIVAVAFIVFFPWALRNYFVMGVFTPLPHSIGFNLYKGNHSGATGGGYMHDRTTEDLEPAMIDKVEKSLVPGRDYEQKRDALFYQEAVRFIRHHPMQSAALFFKKFFLFWGNDIYHRKATHVVHWGSWSVLLVLFLTGLRMRTKDRRQWVLFGFMIVSTLLSMIFFVLPRYSLVITPLVVIFAAPGITAWWGLLQRVWGRKVRGYA